MKKHALLSASSAHRWLTCTPSARFEERLPETISKAAEEGTAAHELAEYKLKKALGLKTKIALPISVFFDRDMDTYTNDYVRFVMGCMPEDGKEGLAYIEQELDLSSYVPEGFGTADCITVSGSKMHVIDLKYGRRTVEAKENPQTRLYALGALEYARVLFDIRSIQMTIFQPRLDNISTEYLEVKELVSWGQKVVVPRAWFAFMGYGEFKAGHHCNFCRAKAECRTY
ncbi:MAG: DUF2800 domain-containing protein, partial [Holosporales bacterium]|nr:DUF2800 domain-containing protein [Holosporales bacterium]